MYTRTESVVAKNNVSAALGLAVVNYIDGNAGMT